MGIWAAYFLGAAYLHFRGALRVEPLPNLALALLLAAPLPRRLDGRGWRAARSGLALVAAAALLWRESWLPAPARAARLLSEAGGVSAAYVARVLAGALHPLDALALAALVAACAVLARRIVLEPLALAAIAAVAVAGAGGAGRGAASAPAELERFLDAEARRRVRLPERPAGDLDVVLLHVCSMSWEDLRIAGLDGHPLLRRFDVVLTAFNSVSSYTNPSAIRLLRAPCGQPRHGDLYRPAPPECYLLDGLRRAGYRTWTAVDNDAPAYRFAEDVREHGHADAPLPLAGLPVRQLDFDGTPIHDDGALLARWLDARDRSGAPRAALYADLTTLHGGARPAGEERWWRRSRADLYREAGERLFANLDAFLDRLEASGRRTLVILVAEHGMALAGSALQPPDLREIPLPAITTVPAAARLVAPGLPRTPSRQASVGRPTSYLAVAHLVAAALDAPAAPPERLWSEPSLARIPETRFVAENEAATVVRAGDAVLWRSGARPFAEVPGAAR